jgi:hypothetical protein
MADAMVRSRTPLLMSKKMMNMLLALLFTCLDFFFRFGEFGFSVYDTDFSPNACLTIAGVSVALFPRWAHNLMLFHCLIHGEISSGQTHDCK